MYTEESNSEFPWVTFTCSRQNKTFVVPRDSIIHAESFQEKDASGNVVVNHEKTHVNFKNPNSNKNNNPLYAVVDMPPEAFRDLILRPAWTKSTREPSNV